MVGFYVLFTLFLRLVMGRRAVAGEVLGGTGKGDDLLADNFAYNVMAVGYALYSSSVGSSAWFGGEAAAMGGTSGLQQGGGGRSWPCAPSVEAAIVVGNN